MSILKRIFGICATQVPANSGCWSYAGGKLEVSARPNQRPGSCLIEISDTGTGIDQESMARVFEPFFTLKKKGTGLGLAIVKSIIEAHRGTIEIDSTPGKATRVTIIL